MVRGDRPQRLRAARPPVAALLPALPAGRPGPGLAAGGRGRGGPGGHGQPVGPRRPRPCSVVLVRREIGDRRWPDRSVWLLSPGPAGLQLGHGLRRGHAARASPSAASWPCARLGRQPRPAWLVGAAVLGSAAGADPAVGVLLVVPVAVEAVRRWRRPGGGRAGWRRPVASSAPVAGPGGLPRPGRPRSYGDVLLPLRVQTQAGHHGGLSDPFRTLVDDARGVLHHHFGTALHVPWVSLVAGARWWSAGGGCPPPTAPSPPPWCWWRYRAPTSTPSSATPWAPSRW